MAINFLDKTSKALITVAVLIILGVVLSSKIFILPLSNKVGAQQEITVSSAKLSFTENEAHLSFQVTNQSQGPLSFSGSVLMKSGLGKPLWEKEFKTELIEKGKAAQVNLAWKAKKELIGKPSLKIILKDNQNKVVVNQEISFIVLPGVLGSTSIVSLMLISRRVGKIL